MDQKYCGSNNSLAQTNSNRMTSLLKSKEAIPFPFILDELISIRPTVKQMFGFTYVYLEDKLLFSLRKSSKQRSSNGMWLFTTTEHLDSLGNEFPLLSKRYRWRSGNNGWVILPSKHGDFEEFAFKACELILSGDKRIVRVTRAKRAHSDNSVYQIG